MLGRVTFPTVLLSDKTLTVPSDGLHLSWTSTTPYKPWLSPWCYLNAPEQSTWHVKMGLKDAGGLRCSALVYLGVRCVFSLVRRAGQPSSMARALHISRMLLRSVALLPDLVDKLFFWAMQIVTLKGNLTLSPRHKQIQLHLKTHAFSCPCSICQSAPLAP